MNETVIDSLIIEISADSKQAGSNIDIVTAALNRLKGSSSSLSKTNRSLSSLSSAIKGISSAKITMALGRAVSSINSYVENVNLFTVSMGKYADEAMKYAERVQSALGVDMSEFIRNQAIFMQMAEGFGLAEESAYQLSKGLTELAYDISSFYNVDMETAFQRLQSGIAGEIEPVRRWGIALDQASMKQWLLKKGIDANVSSLTQADKALVRYNMMVETMSEQGAIGDLARTLETPANAIRILNQQITQLARAIGTLLIPILNKVIPYIQAFVKVVTEAAQALANLLGVNIDFNIDYSGLSSATGAIADSMDDAATSAKKLKDYTMGFDELNIINPNTGTSAESSLAGLGLEALSVWDESIFDAINSKVDGLTGKMKVLLGVVTAVGAAFLAWKITGAIIGGIQAVSMALLPIAETLLGFPSGHSGIAKVLAAISKYSGPLALVVVAITAVSAALWDLWQNSETFRARVRGIIVEVQMAFLELKDIVWNNVVTPILEAFGVTVDSLGDLYSEHIRPVVEKIAIALVEGLGGSIKIVLTLLSAAADVVGVVVTTVINLISSLITFSVTEFTELKDEMKALWEQIKRNTVTKVSDMVSSALSVLRNFASGVNSIVNSIIGFFANMANKVIGYVNSALEGLENLLSKVTGGVLDIDLPEIKSVGTGSSTVTKYASGGVLEDGLFTMNHGEIAGRFNNGQSVVANNQQIIEGIAQGVYEAFVRANTDAGEKPVQVAVYLDGKQITSTVNKKNNERGRTIMGNALGYNY